MVGNAEGETWTEAERFLLSATWINWAVSAGFSHNKITAWDCCNRGAIWVKVQLLPK